MGLMSRTAEHLELLSQMIDKTGARLDADLSLVGANKIRSAMIACVGCDKVGECKQWLAEAEDGSSPPDFCANATKFRSMKV